jgi:hypothetical protein
MFRKGVSFLKATLNEEQAGGENMTAAHVTAIKADPAELAEID